MQWKTLKLCIQWKLYIQKSWHQGTKWNEETEEQTDEIKGQTKKFLKQNENNKIEWNKIKCIGNGQTLLNWSSQKLQD